LLPGEAIKELQTERANVHATKLSPDASLTKTLVEKNIRKAKTKKGSKQAKKRRKLIGNRHFSWQE